MLQYANHERLHPFRTAGRQRKHRVKSGNAVEPITSPPDKKKTPPYRILCVTIQYHTGIMTVVDEWMIDEWMDGWGCTSS